MADEDPPEPMASLRAAEALAVDIDANGDTEVTMDEFSVFAERFLNTPRDPTGPLDPQQVRGWIDSRPHSIGSMFVVIDLCNRRVRACAAGGFLEMLFCVS